MKKPLKHIKQMVFVILCKNLSKNKELENIITRDYFETNGYCTNLSLIFLSLFML